MEDTLQYRYSPWPHRLTVALALVTFPLIWVGGLVTTYDAGMAVPDWPGTYGYNLLLYPWQTWIAAPWDLFIEHGHRLLGSAAGLLAIALVAVVLITDRRRWLIFAACGALGLVIIQGALGGARVLFDERLLALLHGCLGPLFFAYLACLVVVTSQWWRGAQSPRMPMESRFTRSAITTAVLAYAQLIVGAVVRHIPATASPGLFRAMLVIHLVLAAALAAHILGGVWRASRLKARGMERVWPVAVLALLVVGQLALGVATYVAKYSWPAWLGDFQFAATNVIREKSLIQSLVTTGHVANGSLILFFAALAAARSVRVFFGKSSGEDFQTAVGQLVPLMHGRLPTRARDDACSTGRAA